MRDSMSGGAKFYANNRDEFHRFLFVPVIKPSLARGSITPVCGRTDREALESLAIDLFRPSENVRGATDIVYRGVAKTFILRPNMRKDVARLSRKNGFIGKALIDYKRREFVWDRGWHQSYAAEIKRWCSGSSLAPGREVISRISRTADDIPPGFAATVRLGGVARANRLLRSQRFLSSQRYNILKSNLRVILGPLGADLADPIKVHTLRWPWLQANDGLDGLVEVLKAAYLRQGRLEALHYNATRMKTLRINVRLSKAPSLLERFRTPVKRHKQWNNECRCAELTASFPNLGRIATSDGQLHVHAVIDGPIFFKGDMRCSAKTRLRPDPGKQKGAFLHELKRFCSRISLELTSFEDTLIPGLASIADVLDNKRIATPSFGDVYNVEALTAICRGPSGRKPYFVDVIDKPTGGLATLSVCCPRIHYEKADRFLANGAYCRLMGWDSLKHHDPAGDFWQLADRIQGDIPVSRTHSIPVLKLPDKGKSLPGLTRADGIKPRPVVGYIAHRYKLPLQYTSKALAAIAARVHPGYTYTSTIQWIRDVDHFNQLVVSAPGGGRFVAQIHGDISGFFNEIDAGDGIHEIDIALRQIRRVSGFRWVGFRKTTKTWTGRHYECPGIKEIPIEKVEFSRRRPDKRLFLTLSLEDILRICKADVAHCYQRCRGRLFQQIVGTPMGSPLGDRISSFAAYRTEKHHAVAHYGRPDARARRFVDDKAKVFLGHLPDWDTADPATSAAQLILAMPENVQCVLDPILAPGFYPGLTLKPAEENDHALVHTNGTYLGCHVENVLVDSAGLLVAEAPDDLNELLRAQPGRLFKILRVTQRPIQPGLLTAPFAYRTRKQSTHIVVGALHRAYRSSSTLPLGNRMDQVLKTYELYSQLGYQCSYNCNGRSYTALDIFYTKVPEELS